MAIWNTLGIAPTANTSDIDYAFACAACRALDAKDGEALHSLTAAHARAMEAAKGLSPGGTAATPTEKSERLAQLAPLFQRAQNLAATRAGEEAWLELTASPAFLELQDDPYLIGWLAFLCADIYPDMASALYTAYGFASSRALSVHPASGKLRQILMDYCQLPAAEVPFLYQQDILRLSTSTLGGILSLQKEPQSVHLWQQVFQVSDFLIMVHQPHFLRALGRFLGRHSLSGECLLTLAEACSAYRHCPCAEELAARLPLYGTPQAWPPPELFAGFLLQGNAKEFFDGAREKLFFLLERTAQNFRHSPQRHPWDYIFARPQFPLVKHDRAFLERLMAFLQNKALPLPFWQALNDAYREDFLRLKGSDKAAPLMALHDLVHEQLMRGTEAGPAPTTGLRSFPFLLVLGLCWLGATFWLCAKAPFFGVLSLISLSLLVTCKRNILKGGLMRFFPALIACVLSASLVGCVIPADDVYVVDDGHRHYRSAPPPPPPHHRPHYKPAPSKPHHPPAYHKPAPHKPAPPAYHKPAPHKPAPKPGYHKPAPQKPNKPSYHKPSQQKPKPSLQKPSSRPQPSYQKPSQQKPQRPRGPQNKPANQQRPSNQYGVVN